MSDHDGLYRLLFSHPGMVEGLLRDFLAEPWLAELDLPAMRRVNARFQGADGERREGDMVWRIPMRSGGDAYLLLLLEFQSRSDAWMALRVLVYVGLLWQELIRETGLGPKDRLPPVLPLVIYNGDPRWAAPLDLRSLIGLPADSPFWQWQPEMRYHLVDEGAYAPEVLAERQSLAALLFQFEHCRDPAEVVPLVDKVIRWFRGHPDFAPLQAAFAMLAGRLEQLLGETADRPLVSSDLLEVKSMLETRAEQWKQQWLHEGRQEGLIKGLLEGRQEGRREGRQEGLIKGLLEGRQEGEARVLLRLLQRRFGGLPDGVRQRIAVADSATLELWCDRVLDAASLDDVFGAH